MQDAGGARPKLVVRPSAGLVLKRLGDSNDGRGIGLFVLFGTVGVIVLARSSVPLAVVAGAVLASLVVSVAVRLRYEVGGGEIKIGNIARTHTIPVSALRGIAVETLEYEAGGTRYRIIAATDRVQKNGQPVPIPAIATERRRREDVERMIDETGRILAATTPIQAAAAAAVAAAAPASAATAPALAAPAEPQVAPRANDTGRWLPDPITRHEQRYWDGTRWTGHVSDGGVLGSDPLGG